MEETKEKDVFLSIREMVESLADLDGEDEGMKARGKAKKEWKLEAEKLMNKGTLALKAGAIAGAFDANFKAFHYYKLQKEELPPELKENMLKTMKMVALRHITEFKWVDAVNAAFILLE